MNTVITNIWLAVAILIASYILWGALDSFNNKDIIKITIFLNVGGFAACFLHFRTFLRDHADIYKKSEVIERKIEKILGDLPH